jgi:hypothetical protein
LKDLKLDDAHATAVLEKAIEYESFAEDMPASKRERIKAAGDQIALMIDAWVDDEVTPDNEDEDVAAMGVVIADIFRIAGVEVDEEGEVTYVEPGDIEDSDDDDDDDTDADADEAAVDISDIIKDYDELSASGKVKGIKALELDMKDDDDYNTAVAIYEYEEAQDKPSSRVLSWLDDLIPKDEDGDAADAESEDEDADEADADEDEDADAGSGWEEPWAKYDKQTAVDVKKSLDKLLAKDELTVEMAQYVIEYEEGREKPPARKRIIDHAKKLMAELEEGGEDDNEDDEPEPEKPARSGRPSLARATRRRGTPTSSKEPEPEVSSNGAGVWIVEGGDEPMTVFGPFQASGVVADLLSMGYTEITVTAG